jgi:hypothetical protein
MSVTVYVATSDPTLRKGREEAAHKVLEYFGDTLPDLDLKVLLDSAEWTELRQQSGEENRGVFYRVNAHTFKDANWPYHLRDQLAAIDPVTLNLKFTCNAAVYLHDSTCQNFTGLTMTLSHELQHFVQYGRDPRVWAYNIAVTNLCPKTIETLGLEWQDIPIEYEARLEAKRACEAILGTQATSAYIDERVERSSLLRDVADWRFIREIDTSPGTAYDLRSKTSRLYRNLSRFRPELQAILSDLKDDPDFAGLNLDEACGM